MQPILLHSHGHHPSVSRLFTSASDCRSRTFSLALSFSKNGQLATCASKIEGGLPQGWNGDHLLERNGSEKDWWKKIIGSCDYFSSLKYVTSRVLQEIVNDDKKRQNLALKVAAASLGILFFYLNMRRRAPETLSLSAQAIFSWFMINKRKDLSVATPFQFKQFGSISSTHNNQSTAPPVELGAIKDGIPRFSYFMDVLLERHPFTYVLLLAMVCLALVCLGGFLFNTFRSFRQKPGDSLWDAWACLCSSETHLQEKTALERAIGLVLAVGGLFFYSLLISTMTAQFQSHMERLREGAHSKVMEQGHVVICGTNNHLTTVLRHLNKSHQIALREGSTKMQKQTILLLSENERKVVENMMSDSLKEFPQLNVLTRSGSLSSTASFEKVGATKAHSIIVLASDANKYDADAESLLTVLALQPLLDESSGNLIVEVHNANTAELLKSSTSLKVNTLPNFSSKILVQCSRQPGLIDVYEELLEHDRQVLSVRCFSTISRVTYRQLQRSFPHAIVCGLIQDSKVNFHPPEKLLVRENDKVLMISARDMYMTSPQIALEQNDLDEEFDGKSRTFRPSTGSVNAIERRAGPKERILILGWHPRVSEMITEYDDYVSPGTELIILDDTTKEEREQILNQKISRPLHNVQINHQVGNPMSRTDVKAALLQPLPMKLEQSAKEVPNSTKMPLSILVIADSSWKPGDKSSPDKKSALALLLAEDVCKKMKLEVNSLVAEFVDYKLGKQVMKLHPNLKAIGTDEIIGRVTAQVAKQSELSEVWTDLLNPSGDEIYMKGIDQYLKVGELVSFAELAELAQLRNEVAIGYTLGTQTVINPASKGSPLQFSEEDALVVISEYQYT